MIPKPHTAAVVFYVSDITATEAFYRDVLGLDVARQEGVDPFWLTATLDQGLEISFFQMEAKRGTTPALVFSLADGGIDDMIAALAEQGVTIVTPVSEAPGGWSAEFKDPDGFLLSFWQSGEQPRSRK